MRYQLLGKLSDEGMRGKPASNSTDILATLASYIERDAPLNGLKTLVRATLCQLRPATNGRSG